MTRASLQAVLFDFDDTLVPQAHWLAGAWDAVAAAAGTLGADPVAFRQALARIAAEGSARGGIIDRAVAACGAGLPVPPLVEAFRTFRADRLEPFPGAASDVARVRRLLPVGLVSDGDPDIQRAKLRAAGLHDAFDVVVLSDELGREHRKPDPAPYRRALAALGVAPSAAAFVGDRPTTDIVGAHELGMLTVRVRTGEYREHPDVARPDATFATVAEAADWLVTLDVRTERPEDAGRAGG